MKNLIMFDINIRNFVTNTKIIRCKSSCQFSAIFIYYNKKIDTI